MVHLPTNVVSNIIGFLAGFHQAKAEVIARAWQAHNRKMIGRRGRPLLFQSSFGRADNGFSHRAAQEYQRAFNNRSQKIGQLVVVMCGKYRSSIGYIVRSSSHWLWVKCSEIGLSQDTIRVSRESVSNGMKWFKQHVREKSVPWWWGRWVFTGIRI